MAWTDPGRVEAIGVGQGSRRGFAGFKAKSIYEAGVSMVGTHEKGIFDALTGLTKIQGRAVELKYRALYDRDLRKDLEGELYDWAERNFGTRHELDKATALLEGDSAKAVAADLEQAMHGGFLGTGWGTDTKVVFDSFKGKTPAEIAAIKRAYRNATGKDLEAEAKSELDDGWSTPTRPGSLLGGDRG